MYDLLLRGGTVIDGTGLARRRADVAVDDGRIVAVGRLGGAAAKRTIDADGLVVAPGIIDIHTHYDPQVTWDPACDTSVRHGITTVVAGNCGFSIAPCRQDDHEYLAQMFARVEGMDLAAFEHIAWKFETFPEFLDYLEGRLGVNFGCYVGHSSVRRWVMGDAAFERECTPDELELMAAIVDDALRSGAMGFSSSQAPVHWDMADRPVPSRLTDAAELAALVDVVGRYGVGSLAMAPYSALEGYDEADGALMIDFADRAGVPVVIQGYNGRNRRTDPDRAWEEIKAILDESVRRAAPVYSLLGVRSNNGPFTFSQGAATFEGVPMWKALQNIAPPDRKAEMASPDRRAAYRHAIDNPNTDPDQGSTAKPPPWDTVRVRRVYTRDNERYLNRTIADIAAEQRRHPADVIFDISLTDDLKTVFHYSNDTPGLREATRRAQHHPMCVPGISDGGAHLERDDAQEWSTYFLRAWVLDEGVWTLEEAIRQITSLPATVCGIRERGRIEVGAHADLMVFDPDSLDVGERVLGVDRVTRTDRYLSTPTGFRATIVNGVPVVENGELTEATPGAVVRPA